LILATTTLAIHHTLFAGYEPEQQEVLYTPEPVPEEEPVQETQKEVEPPQVEVKAAPQRRYPGPSADARMPDLTEEQVIKLIQSVFPDEPRMVKVARCESGLNPYADRADLGVDVGLFQLNQVHLKTMTELGLDRWDVYDNITYARLLYNAEGLGPWYMSESCWNT